MSAQQMGMVAVEWERLLHRRSSDAPAARATLFSTIRAQHVCAHVGAVAGPRVPVVTRRKFGLATQRAEVPWARLAWLVGVGAEGAENLTDTTGGKVERGLADGFARHLALGQSCCRRLGLWRLGLALKRRVVFAVQLAHLLHDWRETPANCERAVESVEVLL